MSLSDNREVVWPEPARFNVGDIVRVIDWGKRFSTYETMANKMKLPYFHMHQYRDAAYEGDYEVWGVEMHEVGHVWCYGLVAHRRRVGYIVGEWGLKRVGYSKSTRRET